MKKFLTLGILFFMTTAAYSQDTGLSPKVRLEASKPRFETGESIDLKVTITNPGKKPLAIFNPEIDGVTNITVVDANNVSQQPIPVRVKQLPFEKVLTIAPGESYVHNITNLRFFTADGPKEFVGTAQLKPSLYRILVTLTMPPPNTPKNEIPKGSWQGAVSSNLVGIGVFAPGKELIGCTDCKK